VVPSIERGCDFERREALTAFGPREFGSEERIELAAVLSGELGERLLQDRRPGRDRQARASHGRDVFVQTSALTHERAETFRERKRRIDRYAPGREALVLAGHTLGVERLHVVEVLEHRAQRDTGFVGDIARRRARVTRFEQSEQRLRDRCARPGAPLDPAVDATRTGSRTGCHRHRDMVGKSHSECKYFSAPEPPMETVRTPDERFAALADFPFTPHYVSVADGEGGALRVHHLDEGDPAAPVVALMHGEPSWCFLYRKMIPVLVDAGLRCVAPDLVGFGRSDKPVKRDDYSYARHVEWTRGALFDELALRDVTLVGQDWGGLIGLRLVGEQPDRFTRVVAANTFLPTGDRPPGEAFLRWQRFSQTVEDFDVGFIVGSGCHRAISPEVVAAYNAPFPDDSYKAGARQFPTLVPTAPDDPAAPANRNAWETLRAWNKPFLTAFSDRDPVTRGGERAFQREVPGCNGQPHTTIEGGGHFLQEDCGEQLARVIVDWLHDTRTR
jgi:haloalkane dehalogenase